MEETDAILQNAYASRSNTAFKARRKNERNKRRNGIIVFNSDEDFIPAKIAMEDLKKHLRGNKHIEITIELCRSCKR